jgi:polyhydroxyalkanoate synthesis repressor PhaR
VALAAPFSHSENRLFPLPFLYAAFIMAETDRKEALMAASTAPLLIKRYASRRLYNTETSDYVTLEDIAAFIREGREVKIIDLKSGDDLTRQYMLQIIAEHESRGENVLPLDVLTDLVRSYKTNAQSVVPQFLAASFEMLRDGQSKVMENMGAIPSPMSTMPGFEALQRQQQMFLKAMMGGWRGGASGPEPDEETTNPDAPAQTPDALDDAKDMAEIRRQLAELQKRISKL